MSKSIGLTKTCADCGKLFQPGSNRQKYCSDECRRRSRFGDGVCEKCGKAFRGTHPRQRFCSTSCWYETPQRVHALRKCPQCGDAFQPRWAHTVHCSRACANLAKRKPRIITTCQTCGIDLDPRKPKKTKFCSRSCAMTGIVRKGQKPAYRYIDANGYVRVKIDGVWKLEHRHVMEQKLKRPLERRETVHHKNGDRDDNRRRNLQLRIGGHGPGATNKHCPTCSCFDH
jgi:hypothetical protein